MCLNLAQNLQQRLRSPEFGTKYKAWGRDLCKRGVWLAATHIRPTFAPTFGPPQASLMTNDLRSPLHTTPSSVSKQSSNLNSQTRTLRESHELKRNAFRGFSRCFSIFLVFFGKRRKTLGYSFQLLLIFRFVLFSPDSNPSF